MNAFFYALMSLALAATNVNAIGETLSCQTYTSSPKGFECNDVKDIICTEGCKTFVTAYKCTLSEFPKKPATTELCTAYWGSGTAYMKLCGNAQGSFQCTGGGDGQAKCYGCVAANKIPWASKAK